MRFFEKERASAYVQGARLKVDKKTSVRSWMLTLAITMSSKAAHACAEAVVSNYAQISTEENRCSALDIAEEPPVMRLEFFDLEGAKELRLSLSHWTLSGLRMTKVEGLVELWVTCEHVNTDALHRFVRDYAFTRMWVGFVPNQQAPDAAPVVTEPPAAEPTTLTALIFDSVKSAVEGHGASEVTEALAGVAGTVLSEGIDSVSMTYGDQTITIDKPAAERITAKAGRAKKGK